MYQRHDQQIEQGLNDAERFQRFFSPPSAALLDACHRRKRAGLLASPLPRCFARSTYLKKLSRRERDIHAMRTFALIRPNWTFCSFSAALAHGLQVPDSLLGTLHIAVGARSNRKKLVGFAKCHVVCGDRRRMQFGIPVTSIERTLLDCMCSADFCRSLAIVDSALHWGLITHERLEGYVYENGKRRHGIQNARKVLRYADGRSDNGGESIVRGIIIELGFDIPELQVEVDDPMNPGAPKAVDYLWELDCGIVILELDGMDKYRAPKKTGTNAVEEARRRLAAERRRESHLNLTGAKVIRVSFAEATDREHLRRILMMAGIPIVR